MSETAPNRRPLSTRDASWARTLAAWLVHHRIPPNGISVTSIVFALMGGGALVGWSLCVGTWAILCLVVAAAGIQLRLLCNLLDGMVAVEGGMRSPTGDLFNEVPDRFADTVLLVAAGYAVRELPLGVALGWTSAVAAMFTAYIRVLGTSLGGPVLFIGPMAKPHRMALLTLAVLVTACTDWWSVGGWPLWSALVLIVVGSVVTAFRRLLRIAIWLGARPCSPASSG